MEGQGGHRRPRPRPFRRRTLPFEKKAKIHRRSAAAGAALGKRQGSAVDRTRAAVSPARPGEGRIGNRGGSFPRNGRSSSGTAGGERETAPWQGTQRRRRDRKLEAGRSPPASPSSSSSSFSFVTSCCPSSWPPLW